MRVKLLRYSVALIAHQDVELNLLIGFHFLVLPQLVKQDIDLV